MEPLQLRMATVSNSIFHLFFPGFLSVFLFKVKGSVLKGESITESMKILPESSVDKE